MIIVELEELIVDRENLHLTPPGENREGSHTRAKQNYNMLLRQQNRQNRKSHLRSREFHTQDWLFMQRQPNSFDEHPKLGPSGFREHVFDANLIGVAI